MKNLFIIKSKTFKGVWRKFYNKDKNVYAEHYLALGKLKYQPINQMNGMSYKRETLLVFKDEIQANNFCKLANQHLIKPDIYCHHIGKVIPINDYIVKPYMSKKQINNLIPIKTIFGDAYLIK